MLGIPEDKYIQVAARYYGIPVEQVTIEQRRAAKRAALGHIYGMPSEMVEDILDLTKEANNG
jgi:DNA polymerase I-like protein with 3'-5' exonuclease and polymerase domains